MLLGLVKIKELQNSILDRVLETEQTEENTTEVTESLEPFRDLDDFGVEEEQLKKKANRRKKVIRTYFTFRRLLPQVVLKIITYCRITKNRKYGLWEIGRRGGGFFF